MFVHQNQEKKKRLLSKGVLISMFVIAVILEGYFGIFDSALNYLAVPVWENKNSFWGQFGLLITSFKSKESLVAENNLLKEQLAEALVASSTIDMYVKENAALKEVVGRIDSQTDKKVIANILVKPPESLYDTFVLDVGVNDGVKVGDLVSFTELALGRIKEVFPSSSKAEFFSSSGQKIGILIGPKNIKIDAYGRGGGNFVATLPKEIPVVKGDSVVFPEVSSKIVGVVDEVLSEPSNAIQTILFKIPVNISELQWVEVTSSNTKNVSTTPHN